MRRTLIAGVLSATTIAAHAQTLPDTVVTATRTPTRVETIPAGVTIIDRQTIEEQGFVSLVDALQFVPGLRVVQTGGAGGQASVFIRGTNSNHVLVLRDGVPINDASTANGAFNFGIAGLADVQRIEVIRGPMSGLYGSGAIGGVINLITRQGGADGIDRPHGQADIAGGLPAQGLGAATFSGLADGFDYSLTLAGTIQRGFDVTPKRVAIHTGETDGFRSGLATINLGYTPAPGTRFGATLRGQTAGFGLDNVGGFPGFDGSNYTGSDADVFGHLSAVTTLFDGAWQTGVSLARIQDDRHYIQTLAPEDPNQATNDDRYHGRRVDFQWNNTVQLPELGPATASQLTFGFEHITDTATVRVNSASFGFPFTQNVDTSSWSNAGSAGLQTTLWNRLTLIGAIRGEGVRDAGSAVTWRAGGVLALPELWSHLKLSYGTAYRAPSLFDRYGIDSFGYQGNPALRPERSEGWEAGWTLDVPGAGRASLASLSVTYFHNRVNNLIVTQFSPVYTSVNIDQARTQGVETTLTLRPATWLEAELSYTYTDARNLADDSLLLRRPYNAASGSLRIAPLPGLVIVPELQYIGEFRDSLVDNGGFSAGTGPTGHGLIANLAVSYAATPAVTVYLNASNVFGSRFEPASGFATPGPSVLAGTRFTF